MKILKYKKIKNKYRVYLDDDSYIDLYENIILKYDLLIKKEINKSNIDKIRNDNKKEEVIDLSIKYISTKMRTKKEVYNYLKKKEFSKDDIDNALIYLETKGLINEENYIKAYIYDKFNLSSDGPNKIRNYLINEGMDKSLIEKNIKSITENEILEKLDRLVTKKINLSKNCSGSVLKYKIINYFYNLGYDKKYIDIILENKNLNNNEQGIKEYNKLYSKYSKKYSGYDLENIIKQKLYIKGYDYEEIKKGID